MYNFYNLINYKMGLFDWLKGAARSVGSWVSGAAKKVGQFATGLGKKIGSVARDVVKPVAEALSFVPVIGAPMRYLAKASDFVGKLSDRGEQIAKTAEAVGSTVERLQKGDVKGAIERGREAYETGRGVGRGIMGDYRAMRR
jgi:hypothetical protein